MNVDTMDDLDHSVLIADQDWDSFCEESEECSLLQPGLAALEDSGLSDTDEEKSTVPNPAQLIQSNQDDSSVSVKGTAEPQTESTQDESGSSSSGNPSGQLCDTDYLRMRVTKAESPPPEEMFQNALKDPQEQMTEAVREDIAGEAITFSTCDQISKHAKSSAQHETDDMVSERQAGPQTERERWFVTVNDRPKHLQGDVAAPGQKKRRKKKPSRKRAPHSNVALGPSGPSQPEAEEDGGNEAEEQTIGAENALELPCNMAQYGHNHQTRAAGLRSPAVSAFMCDSKHKSEIRDTDNHSNVSVNCTEEVCTHEPVLKNTHHNLSKNELEMQEKCKRKETLDERLKIENLPTSSASPSLSPSIHVNVPKLPLDDPSYPLPQLARKHSAPRIHRELETKCLGQSTNDNLSQSQNDKLENRPRFVVGDTAPCKASDNLQSMHENVAEHKSYALESMESSTESLKPLEEVLGPSRPIYAISSFWDEMEKLTINDIVNLRVANNRSPMRGGMCHQEITPLGASVVHLGDRGLLDAKDAGQQNDPLADDTADSDYFTHLDDSKPDRSSCEFSNLSDFDEDFLKILSASANPSPEPQDETQRFMESVSAEESLGTQTSEVTGLSDDAETDTLMMLCSEESLGTQTSDVTGLSDDAETDTLMMLCSDDGIPLYLYQESPNLHLDTYQDSEGNTILVDDSKAFRATPSPVLSNSDIVDEHFLMSIQELFQEDDKQQIRSMARPSSSSPSTEIPSVPESYEHFFSDFEVGNLFFPSVQGAQRSEDETVPIFSCSRSAVRDMAFPDVEETSESEDEDESVPIRVLTRFSTQARQRAQDGFLFSCQRRNWGSLFSLRRVRFTRSRDARSKVTQALTKITDRTLRAATNASITHPTPLAVHQLESKVLWQFRDQRNLVPITKRDGFLFSLKQADMCLVCIAFASWVLKSTNPQSTDTWKAALLANVSAISAIQYLRKYVREDMAEQED